MTFSEPPALFWESVILQCEKQQSLRKLTPVLLSRYPKNDQLIEAVAPWINVKSAPPRSLPEGKKAMPKAAEPTPPPQASGDPAAPPLPATNAEKAPPAEVKAGQQPINDIGGSAAGIDDDGRDPPLDIEYVSVTVPKELAAEATTALVATIRSLKITVDQIYKDVAELVAWRQSISTLSRAEVANSEGGNEPGPNRNPGGSKGMGDGEPSEIRGTHGTEPVPLADQPSVPDNIARPAASGIPVASPYSG